MDTFGTVQDDGRQQLRADHVVAMARRHAEEIRAAAERDAEHVIREAENRATLLQQQRLDMEARELERLTTQRREIENCLGMASSALARIHALLAVSPDAELSQSREPSQPSPPSREAAEAIDQRGRHHALQRIVVITCSVLAVWFVVMVPALGWLAHRAEPEADVNVAPNHDTEPVPTARGSTLLLSPSRSAASTSRFPSATAEASGLTVVFTALGDCWISVASDDGAATDRLLRASETHTVTATDVVSFKAGNAGALSLVINDHQARTLGSAGQVVSRRITRANYRQFVSS